MSVNPERSAPVTHEIVVEELGRLVLCKRPIEVQYFAERTSLVGLARFSFPEAPVSASKLLDRLIAEAIDSIGIELVEDAADALLTDRLGERWVALADRQDRAAGAISEVTGSSLTRDGFRRKRKGDGKSRQDDVLEHVALAIIDITGGVDAPAEPPEHPDSSEVAIAPVSWPANFRPDPEIPAIDPGSTDVVAAADRIGRRATVAAAIVIVGLLAVGVVAVTRRPSTGRRDVKTEEETAYDCPIAPAETTPGLDAAPEQIEFLARTLADHLDETGMACPDRLADYWGDTDLVVQQLSSTATGWSGVLVATPEQMGFTLTGGQWAGLVHAQELAAEGDNPDFVPFNEEHREGASWVEADAGWLVGERWGQPHFLVGGAWQRVWERNGQLDGRLGRPTSFVYGNGDLRRQDFEGGYLSATDGSVPTPHFDETRAPPPVRPGDRIQQPDGTEWLIGTDGQRIWAELVPDRLPATCSTAPPGPADTRPHGIHRIDGTRAARVPLSPSCTF